MWLGRRAKRLGRGVEGYNSDVGVRFYRRDAEGPEITRRKRNSSLRFVCALCVSAVSLFAQQAGLEARARELKARGDASGALALYQQADPKPARVLDEIGFLL